jgi:opacity protein-like surface antigen
MKLKQLKKSIRPLVCVAGVSFSALAFAGGIEIAPSHSAGYVSVFGGANWITTGQTAAVNLGGLVTNLYVGNSSTSQAGPIAGASLGYHFHKRRFWLNLGAESSYTQVTSPSGRVRPLFFINPTFDTLNFNYQVQAVPLFGELMLGGRFGVFEPYAIAGAGVSWNQAYNYNEVPTNPNGTALPARTMFNSRTLTEFAWNAGVGFGLRTTRSTSLGFEYRYTNYGNLALNPAGQQGTNQTVNLGELSSNALLARVTVIFR